MKAGNEEKQTSDKTPRTVLVPNKWGFPGVSGKESARQGRRCKSADLIPGSGRSPGRGHGSPRILAWRISRTEEPGGL